MENLNQLFVNVGTEASILILSWLIIAFLLGLLAGYFLRNRYVNELSRQLDEKDQQLTLRQNEVDRVQQELVLKEADLKRAAFEAEEARSNVRRTTEENNRLTQLIGSAQAELEKLHAAEQVATHTINDLSDELSALKASNAQLVASGNKGGGDLHGGSFGNDLALDRLAAIEIQLSRLIEENHSLSQKTGEDGPGNVHANQHVETSTTQDVDTGTVGEFFVPKIASPEPINEVPNMGSNSSNLMNTDKVLLRNVDKNDLTAIDGVGPFLEKKLNDVGVFTYADIAAWDAARISEITQQISFFEGRIEKDNWVGQAKNLLEARPSEFAADSILAEARGLVSAETSVVEAEKNNLKLILGIDEAVEKIFFSAGIDSFAELAKLDPDEIRNILVVVDPNLAAKDPSAWPAQARLALDGEWEVLQDYQEQLKK